MKRPSTSLLWETTSENVCKHKSATKRIFEATEYVHFEKVDMVL